MNAPDRSERPAAGAIRPFDFPEVDSDRLANGIDVRLCRMSRLPLATVTLVLDAGEETLTNDRAGLAVLAGDALEGGTTERDGAELAEALEGIGATLDIVTGWASTTIGVSCLADRLDEAMALLAELALRPSFPEGEVERLRDETLATLRQRAMLPRTLAADTANRLYYEDGAPYGRPASGSVESVAAITPKAARGFTDTRYTPGKAGVVAVGDLDAGEFRALVDDHFGGWDRPDPEPVQVEATARTGERQIVVVDRPGSVQSELRMGHVGAPRSTPDFFELMVINAVLGGSFTSRLNLNLREKNGFTYGVRSRFAFRRAAGPFQVSTAVGTEQTADAVREALFELERLLEHGADAEEIEAQQDFLVGVFPLQLETTGQIASRLSRLLIYGLEDDYYAHYRDRIRAVTPQGALEAARRHIRPGEMTITIVGDAATLVEPLEALDVGPVGVLDGAG